MNYLTAAAELRELADKLEAERSSALEVPRGGITLEDAVNRLKELSNGDYFSVTMNVVCHRGDRPTVNWSTYGFTSPRKSFEAPTLAALVGAVVNHLAEPATLETLNEVLPPEPALVANTTEPPF